MSDKWYSKSASRLLVDMHIPDWDSKFFRDFSAENYADMMATAKVDTVEIYAGSCLGLCNWPTNIGHKHKNVGEIDLLGETINACRKRNLKVVIYLNVWSRKVYDEHPEWRMLSHNGKSCVESNSHNNNKRVGICCPNTGFGEYFIDLLDELNHRYECVGFWIDMIGWFGNICFCPACQKRFCSESDFVGIPRVIDWNNPAWLAFQGCRERWLAEFAKNVRNVVKSYTPERSVALQSSSLILGWTGALSSEFCNQSDYLAADLYGNQYEQSMICKLFNALSNNKPIEFMVPRCENLNHHTTNRSFINLEMRSFASLANQSSFTLIDAIDPRGTLNKNFYKQAGIINQQLHLYSDYLREDSNILADVAIYYSFSSIIDLQKKAHSVDDAGLELTAFKRNMNIVHALQEQHLSFTFVGRKNIDKLNNYPVLILSDCSNLEKDECEAIIQYVKAGGKVYASGFTSLYDNKSGCRSDFALAKLFGVHFTGETTSAVNYLTIVSERLSEIATKGCQVMLERSQVLIEVDPNSDVKVLATLTLPYSLPEENVFFGSAISNPPEINTGDPALVKQSFGKGEVIYCAGAVEYVEFDFHRNFFSGLINSLVGGAKIINSNAPGTVEFTLFEQAKDNRLILSLLNFTSELPPVPIQNIQLSLAICPKLRIKGLFKLPHETKVNFKLTKNNHIDFFIPTLDKFAMYMLKTEGI